MLQIIKTTSITTW